MLDRAEIRGGVIFREPAFVVLEDHVEDPVQSVLDEPVASHHRGEQAGDEGQRGDVEPGLALGPWADLALALDDDDRVEVWPVVTRLDPPDVVDDRDVSGFDPAMIAIDALGVTGHRVLEANGFLLGDEHFDVVAQCTLVALEGEQIIGLFFRGSWRQSRAGNPSHRW